MQLHFHKIPIRKCTIQSKHKIIKDSTGKRIGMHRGLPFSNRRLVSVVLDVCGPPRSFGTTSFSCKKPPTTTGPTYDDMHNLIN
jgi:hypothetical protein